MQVVEDAYQEQRDRTSQVEGLVQGRVVEDRPGLAEVGEDEGGPALLRAGHQGAGVRQHDWVVVDIEDPAFGSDSLSDLMDVVQRRDSGADVQKLSDAG